MATVIATRALTYTHPGSNGEDLIGFAVRGQAFDVEGDQLERFRRRGSVADPGSPEAQAAQEPRRIGSAPDLFFGGEREVELATKATGLLSPTGPVASAGAEALLGLDDAQLRVQASALGINIMDRSRDELVADIVAGTGAQGAALAARPKRRGRPPKSEASSAEK